MGELRNGKEGHLEIKFIPWYGLHGADGIYGFQGCIIVKTISIKTLKQPVC